MADDKEVTITIRATNLSAEAFQKAREQIAGLQKPIDDSTKAGASFQQQFLGAKNVTALFSDQVKTLIAGFTIASMLDRAVSKLFEFGSAAFESAGHLTKLNNTTGISLDGLQRMAYVAAQTGTTVDAFADTIFKLGLNVAKGGDDTRSAVQKMGVAWDTFKALSPEQQFNLIVSSIDKLGPVSERNAALTALFGKGVGDTVNAMVSDYQRLASQAVVAGDQQLRKLDELAAKWDGFHANSIVRLAAIGGRLVQGAEIWGGWFDAIGGGITAVARAVAFGYEEEIKVSDQQVAAMGRVVAGLHGTSGATADNTKFIHDQLAAREKQAQSETDFGMQLVQSKALVGSLSAEQRKQIESGVAMGKSEKDIADALNKTAGSTVFTTTVVSLYKDQLAESKKKSDEAAQATAAYKKEIAGLADEFTGRKLAQEVTKTSQAFELAGGAAGMTKSEIKDLVKQLDGYLEKGGQLTPMLADFYVSHVDLSKNIIPGTTESLLKLTDAVGKYGSKVQAIIPPLFPIVQSGMDAILAMTSIDLTKIAVKQPRFHDGLKGALEQGLTYAIDAVASSKDIGAALGVLGSSVADQIGGYFATLKGAGPLTQGFGHALQLASQQPSLGSAITAFAGSMAATMGTQLGGMLGGPLGAAIGGALGSTVGPILNHFFGTAGRDAVETFGAQFGGLDNLHKRLGEVFDSATAEKYWISLTQGVGKNNPAEAKRIIDEIAAAMADQKTTVDGMVPTWKDAVDIAKSYGGSIEQLGPKFQQQQLSERSLQLVTDMKKLQAAGADVNDIMGFMGDEFQDVITQALKYGLEVPEKMRPVAEEMLKQGKLTDENGDKLTDLSKLTWSTTVTEQFSKLIDKLDKFIDKLTTGVGAAAQTAAAQAEAALGNLSFNIPVNFDVSEHGAGSGSGDGGWTGPQYASGGIAEGRQVAMLAERGRREIVGDQSFMTDALTGALNRLGMSGGGSTSSSGGMTSGGNRFFMLDGSGNQQEMSDLEFAQRFNRAAGGGMIRVPLSALMSRLA